MKKRRKKKSYLLVRYAFLSVFNITFHFEVSFSDYKIIKHLYIFVMKDCIFIHIPIILDFEEKKLSITRTCNPTELHLIFYYMKCPEMMCLDEKIQQTIKIKKTTKQPRMQHSTVA